MATKGVTLYYYEDYAADRKTEADYDSIASISLTEKENYKLTVSATGVAKDIRIFEEGIMEVVNNSYAEGITIYATTKSANMDGYLYVSSEGIVADVAVYGDAEVDNKGVLYGANVFSGGTVSLFANGYLENSTVADGGRVYSYSSCLYDLTLENGSLIALYDGIGETITMKSGSQILLNNNAILQNVELQAGSSLNLSTGSILSGAFNVSAGAKIRAEDGTGIEFILRDMSPDNNAYIADFTDITGTPYYFLTVSDAQAAGTYALAGNAGDFAQDVYVACDSYSLMQMSIGAVGTYHNSVYQLSVDNGTLTVTVADYATSASADGLAWADINDAAEYALALSDGGSTLELTLDAQGADLLGLAAGDYAWRVRNAAEDDNWQYGQAFSQADTPAAPQQLTAAANGRADLFFARTDGVWEAGYAAQHMGTVGGWEGTGEIVRLEGKQRVTDLFTGSDDASVLWLDAFDAADGTRAVEQISAGTALFLDDIYSALPEGTEQQARVAAIDTIVAGNNGDLIDLTSQRFTFNGGITVYGGDGDDVVWANSGNNTLFGGDGDDRLVGAAGDDVLIGGEDDDILHGGGGSDIFCFGDNWGQDTVEQLSDGKVTLWFAEGSLDNWDATSLTYRDNQNTVAVTGVDAGSVTVKIGDDGSELYGHLLAAGAF